LSTTSVFRHSMCMWCRLVILAVAVLPTSPALPKPQTSAAASESMRHRPWWHERGHLSDYATCRPRAEDMAAGGLDVGALAAGGQQDAATRPSQAGHFRDEFLNIANEVPELAAMFVPDAAQPELLEWPHSLPLSLCPSSLQWYLSNVYRQRASSARRAARLPRLDAAAYSAGQSLSVGYELQRVWLDAMFGHLGGARGRIPVQLPVQRALENARQHRRVPQHVGTGGAGHCDVASCDQGSWRYRDQPVTEAWGCRDEASSYQAPSRFYLPDFLCQEIKVDAKLSEDYGRCHLAPFSPHHGRINGLPDCNGLPEWSQAARRSHVATLSTDSAAVPAKARAKGAKSRSKGKGRGRLHNSTQLNT
jgi:hypothetical protein